MEEGQKQEENKKSKIILIIVLILLLLLISAGLIYYFVFYDKNISNNYDKQNNNSTVEENEAKKEEVDLSQYDGKILKITSNDGNIEGSGYVVYDKDEDILKLEYVAILNADLPVNGTCGGSTDGVNSCDDMIRHEYAQKTVSQKYPERDYDNFLFPVLCNKDKQLNHEEYKNFMDIYSSSACEVDDRVQEKTSTFLVRGKYMKFESYEEMLGMYNVIIYNASQYWVEDTSQALTEEEKARGERRFTLESKKSILSENEVRRYIIEIKEQLF